MTAKPPKAERVFGSRVLKNLSSLMVIQGFKLIIPVITLPYILRTVGLENYGHVALSIAIATFLGSIIQYGFSITAVREISQVRDDPAAVSEAFWRNFLTGVFLCTVIAAIYFTMVLSVPFMKSQKTIYFGAFFLIAGNSLFPHWLFLGLERTHFVVLCTAFTRMFYIVLLVLFIRAPQDYILINFLGASSAFLNIVFALYFILGYFKLHFKRVSLQSLLKTLKIGFNSFLIQWTPNLYNSATILILGLNVSAGAFGVFNAANAVVTLVISVGRLLSNAFLPILSTSFEKHRIVSTILICFGLVSMALVLVFAPFIASFLADEGRTEIARDLRYIALGIPFVSGYFAFGLSYVALVGQSKLGGYSSLWVSVAGMVLALVLVPAYGPIGAAIVLLVTRASLFAASYLAYRSIR